MNSNRYAGGLLLGIPLGAISIVVTALDIWRHYGGAWALGYLLASLWVAYKISLMWGDACRNQDERRKAGGRM
jgi:hypothetical protein